MGTHLEQYILAVHGTVVSILLFVFSYRQTLGARKERARAANAALERIILRRIVQEAYKPKPEELELLRQGLTAEYGVKLSELADFQQVAAALYTRIADSDFLSSDNRDALLSSLVDVLATPEPITGQLRSGSSNALAQRTFIGVLAVAASLAGSVLGALPFLGSISTLVPEVLSAFGLSLGAIGALVLGRRVRDRADAGKIAGNMNSRQLNEAVLDALNEHSVPFDWNRGRASYDYRIVLRDRAVLLELKALRPWLPSALVHQITSALPATVRAEGAAEAWVIVPDDTPIPNGPAPSELRFLTLSQFRSALDADIKSRA